MKRWIWALMAILILSACGSQEEETPRRAIQYLEVSKPAKGQVRRISGVVEAGTQADISFQVSGHVKTVSVNLGDTVDEGQTLASLDLKPFNLNVDTAQAELTKANAVLIDKKTDYEAKAKLLEQKYVAKNMVDTARAEYEAALQNIESAKSKLELAKHDLDNAVLKAPFRGDISAKNIEAGMNIAAGKKVFHLVGKTGFEVAVSVPEGLRKQIYLNMPVQVSFPTLGMSNIKGEISEIAAAAHDVNAFLTTIRLHENELSGLYPGLTAEVRFEFKDENKSAGYLIPASALLPGEKQGEGYVFVYDPERESVHKRKVTIKNVRDNDVEVTEGLNAGDIIATAGIHFLVDGQPVNLYEEP